MRGNGLKVKDFVSLFHLEVLNRGSDFDTAVLTIPDLNRPGLQFLSFFDYFDPCRLQVIGKAEVTYLRGLSEARRRKCFDDLFLYDIPALVIAGAWIASRSAWRAPWSTRRPCCGPAR